MSESENSMLPVGEVGSDRIAGTDYSSQRTQRSQSLSSVLSVISVSSVVKTELSTSERTQN